MAAGSGNNGGGRRSKGDRRLIGTRVSVEYRDRAVLLAERRGQTMSDFVESLIVKAVDEAEERAVAVTSSGAKG